MEKSQDRPVLQVLLPLAITALTFWLFKLYWDKRNFFKLASLIPEHGKKDYYSAALSLIGKTMNEKFQFIHDHFGVSPPIFKLWFGFTLVVGVSKPEHIEVVLTSPNTLSKSHLIEFSKPFMGDGLFTAPVNTWKRHRKILSPVFSQRALNSFIPIFAEKCDVLIGVLEKHVGQKNFDITGKISSCILEIICESVMGLRIEAQSSSKHFGKLLDRAMELVMVRIANFLYHSQTIYNLSSPGREFLECVSKMNKFTKKVIAERKAEFEMRARGEYIEEKGDNIKTFLDLILEESYNGNKFTDQEIQDEVNTFIAAGSDTTTFGLGFCCTMLGMFPECQQKMYEEAIEVLGHDRFPTKVDMSKLKYTEMFIKETLRVFPAAPLLLRVASGGEIKLDDLVIPKDTVILLGVLHMQRSPEYWEDPMKFDPYRFSPEEWSKKNPYSYLPFSAGPRNCFGYKHGLMNMKLILSKMVRKFVFKTDYKSIEEIKVKINLLMRPEDGFKVTLELRE